MDAYGRLFGSVIFPAWETIVRRRPTVSRLHMLERTQWLPLEELVAMQLGDLRALVRHAMANVPHYTDTFGAAGVVADEIRSYADLLRLPLLSRDDAQASEARRRSTTPPFVEIEKSTSGTQGRPVTFGYERDSETWRQAVRLRAYGWAGYHPGARTLHFWGPSGKSRGWRKTKVDIDHALRRDLYLDCSVRSAERLDAAIEQLKRFRPELIICFSTGGADLARRVTETGARTWKAIPVICGAEALLPSDRAAIAEAFGPAVFETYGSREVMLMASECAEHDGLHVAMENVLLEVLVRDGDRMRHAAPGEVGEVAVTDLHNRAMPFIRYLNGDRAVAGEAGRCACQRQLARLRSIEGRVTAMLRDGTGAPVGGLFVHALLAHVGHAFRQFQAVQRGDGSVTLRLVKSSSFDDAAHRYLIEGFARYLPGVHVRTDFVDDIPIGAGGKRQVILREA
jgi:phenylacetate-CoA ligase